MRELARRIDACQDRFGRGVSWLSLAMVAVVSGDVLSRYLFRATSAQGKAWLDFALLWIFFFPSCLLVIYTAWPFVRDSWAKGWEASPRRGREGP
jgi:TRAP-type mannitol/chloroaromatic compound transport system permease small subunit